MQQGRRRVCVCASALALELGVKSDPGYRAGSLEVDVGDARGRMLFLLFEIFYLTLVFRKKLNYEWRELNKPRDIQFTNLFFILYAKNFALEMKILRKVFSFGN